MKPWWSAACALLLLAEAGTARAAWDNVFQACCFGCRNQNATSNYLPAPAVSYASPACCDPCPQPVCTTRYVQRCYYQPVTSYTTKTYYEPVTTYRTSYYYEPVTSYRYSCYVDPCTGCQHQVACPQTCYRLRSQCCPVQSWVQRCCQVPVQSYRIASYWEPVTSCCQPQSPCGPTASACPNGSCGSSPQPGVAVAPAAPAAPVPGVSEQRLTPQPGVSVTPNTGGGSPLYDRYYPPSNNAPKPMNPSTGLRPDQVPPVRPAAAPAAPPAIRLDRIVSLPQSSLQGRIVASRDDAPRPGAQIVFVSAAKYGQQQVTADANGKFRVTLASGDWLVYVNGADQRPTFHSRINLGANEIRQVVLVSQ